MKYILFFLIATICTVPLIAQKSKREISNLLAQEKEFNGVILYAKKGKVKFHKAYGYRNYHTKQSLLSTDIFELASVSKQFTSMIIMMLQEEGGNCNSMILFQNTSTSLTKGSPYGIC